MYDKFTKNVGFYDDIYWMLGAHIVAIFCTTIRSCISSKTNTGNFVRNLLNWIKVWTFLLCLISVMIAYSQYDDRVSLAQIKEHNCPGLTKHFGSIDDYRKMELVVFYSMVGGLLFYIIVSKMLSFCKMRNSSQ